MRLQVSWRLGLRWRGGCCLRRNLLFLAPLLIPYECLRLVYNPCEILSCSVRIWPRCTTGSRWLGGGLLGGDGRLGGKLVLGVIFYSFMDIGVDFDCGAGV